MYTYELVQYYTYIYDAYVHIQPTGKTRCYCPHFRLFANKYISANASRIAALFLMYLQQEISSASLGRHTLSTYFFRPPAGVAYLHQQ